MRILALLLALLPAVPLVFAAEEAETPPAPVEDTQAAGNGTGTEAEEEEEEEGEEAAAAEDAGGEEAEDSVAVIEDFIPSTQISEDLSVSFPVDI